MNPARQSCSEPVTFQQKSLLRIAPVIATLLLVVACSDSSPPAEPPAKVTDAATGMPAEATPALTDPATAADVDDGKNSADGNCLADSNWFPHNATPRPVDSAFKSISNCVFHKWSWQMFLWLTQDDNGQPRFLRMQEPQSLLGFTYRGLLPRKIKSNTVEPFDEFLQAGTDGIMVDHHGRGVYYSQHINSTFVDFITTRKLTDPANVRDLPPATTFPIAGGKGALELKVSWMIVEEGDDVSDMFTMETEVARLINKNGAIVIDPDSIETAEVALVGFHIGGVVAGHPEMIWATFEHKRNAPNVPPGATADTVVSQDSSIFYTGGTTYQECNVNPAISRTLKLDEATQTLSPITQVCRLFEFGSDPETQSEDVKTNDANISKLNASVQSGIEGIWSNYFEVGAIWFKDGNDLKPGLSLADDSLLTGSLRLSNSTIETFTQTQSVMNNCFRCHNTKQEFPPGSTELDPLPATNLNISHAFQNIYFWSQIPVPGQQTER